MNDFCYFKILHLGRGWLHKTGIQTTWLQTPSSEALHHTISPILKTTPGVHTEFRKNHQLLTMTYKALWIHLSILFLDHTLPHCLPPVSVPQPSQDPRPLHRLFPLSGLLLAPLGHFHTLCGCQKVLNCFPCSPCLDDPTVSPAPISHHPVRFFCCCLFYFAGISLFTQSLSHLPTRM